MAALYEMWYRDCHYNPVKLTSRALRKYGVSRWQKYRALKVLEKSGWIWIEREPRKSPFVTMKWLPLKSEYQTVNHVAISHMGHVAVSHMIMLQIRTYVSASLFFRV